MQDLQGASLLMEPQNILSQSPELKIPRDQLLMWHHDNSDGTARASLFTIAFTSYKQFQIQINAVEYWKT